jgi:hypothetical protein
MILLRTVPLVMVLLSISSVFTLAQAYHEKVNPRPLAYTHKDLECALDPLHHLKKTSEAYRRLGCADNLKTLASPKARDEWRVRHQ